MSDGMVCSRFKFIQQAVCKYIFDYVKSFTLKKSPSELFAKPQW
jgi:hypothetical protein